MIKILTDKWDLAMSQDAICLLLSCFPIWHFKAPSQRGSFYWIMHVQNKIQLIEFVFPKKKPDILTINKRSLHFQTDLTIRHDERVPRKIKRNVAKLSKLSWSFIHLTSNDLSTFVGFMHIFWKMKHYKARRSVYL